MIEHLLRPDAVARNALVWPGDFHHVGVNIHDQLAQVLGNGLNVLARSSEHLLERAVLIDRLHTGRV